MADLQFYLNNVNVPPPLSWEGMEIECSFENNSPDATIKSTTFEWLGDDAKNLNTWVNKGLNGGCGIFEGEPFKITACTPPITVFDGCVDFTHPETTFQCDIVRANVLETQRIQFLNDRAESFSFSYLQQIGNITSADYVSVPYVISAIPDYLQCAILVVSFIEMFKLIKDAVNTIIGYVQSAVAAYPIVWEMALYSALATAATIYAVLLTVLSINMLNSLLSELIQPIKFKYGMRVKDLFQKGCDYLGIGFSSTILQIGAYKDLVIIPQKKAYYQNITTPTQYYTAMFGSTVNKKVYDEVQNPTAYGYYDGTFAQLIREMCDVFNSKVVIRNNILYFERWDFWNNNSVFTMPNQSSESPFDDPYGTNSSEISSNYFITYLLDSEDTNTYDHYEGTTCQMTLSPVITSNVKNILLKGLHQVNINYALAKRKTDLTRVEQLFNLITNKLGTLWSDFVSALGGIGASLPNDIINDRVGAMLLSSDFTGIQKLVVVDERTSQMSNDFGNYNCNKISVDNSYTSNYRSNGGGWTDAFRLAKDYHSASWAINTLEGSVTYPNQYLVYKDKEVPLCCSAFANLINNNIIQTFDFKKGRLDSMRWNPFNETAKVDYRIKQVYTNNLKQSFIVNGIESWS